ncbi:MAG TPA: hypothetical protein VFV99_33790 [Kofleriaceae bacterium]|nr:hypothetical protein [Kofleriaceae bacterium]
MPNDPDSHGSPDAAKVRLICSMCSQPYFATAGTNPGECVSCMLGRAEAEARQAAHERKQAGRRALASRITNRVGARLIVGVIVLAIGGVLVAWQAVQHAREKAAERHRANASANVYVIKTENWKWRMCHCEDFACAAQVKADFEAWTAKEAAPDDADVKRAAKSATDSLLHCYDQLR